MTVFHEFFPIEKQAITDYVKRQMEVESLNKIGGGDVEICHQLFEIPCKDNVSDLVRGLVSETHFKLKTPEDVDGTDFFNNPLESIHEVNQDRFEVASKESILSFDKRRKLETGDGLKFVSPAPPSTPKPQDDHSIKKLEPKLPSFEPELKPKQRSSRTNDYLNQQRSPGLSKSISMPVFTQTFSGSSKVPLKKKNSRCLQNLPSSSVQKMLNEVKEKRKVIRNEIKVPVVELTLAFKRP